MFREALKEILRDTKHLEIVVIKANSFKAKLGNISKQTRKNLHRRLPIWTSVCRNISVPMCKVTILLKIKFVCSL